MKKEEIKRLAGLAEIPVGITGGNPTWQKIQKFAAMVAAAEREACAQVCSDIANKPSNIILGVAITCADAIRARGQE